jgi:hypothetical protein
MVALAKLLGTNRPVDLPLIVLTMLVKYRQQHDRAIRCTPIRYPDRHLMKPQAQLPHRARQVIAPRPAQGSSRLSEEPAHLVDPFEVSIAKGL